MSDTLPRHEWWRQSYRAGRYMHGLSDGELIRRFADVMTNQLILTDEGQIGIVGLNWLEKFTHLDEEFKARSSGFPQFAQLDGRVVVPRTGVCPLGERVRKKYGGIPSKFMIFKYGNRAHLEPLHLEGRLRLCPASYYDDPSLNFAVSDSELSFEKIRGLQRTRYVQRQDYYCFCGAWIHRERLVSDFGATAVLVVTEPHEFFKRLATALDQADYDMQFNRVTYVDPLLVDDHEIEDLRFIKHMRFTYQAEHRFVASPKGHGHKLEVRNLSLGSLTDISELF